LTTTQDVVAVLATTLGERIGEARYNLWFAGKTNFAFDGDHLHIGVPNLFLHDWLQKTFGDIIQATANEVLGAGAKLRYLIEPALFQASRSAQNEAHKNPQPARADAPHERGRPVQTRRWRRLEEFIVGPSNRVAHASAVSLVEMPEDAPIPLVLHGAVGVGKTHLLEGIWAGLTRRFPDWRVLYLTAEDFINRFVAAMHQHKLSSFRKQFRECDALLIDDVGFLAKKNATQEEFLHTIDALIANQRPVVLTSDCHPRMADHFLPELTDRLVGGNVWSLTTPDRPTRLELLRAKSLRAGGLPPDVLEFLADNLRGNVRELEGAVHSVVHLGRVTARPLGVELAREALGDILRHSIRIVKLDDVENAICGTLAISRELLLSKKRQWVYSYPRMLAMFLARKHTSATHAEVGAHFGNRNHSTVVAAEKKVRQWLKDNITLQLGKRIMPVREIVEQIERALEN
jgi:chromosomal replication initiator protein